MGFFERSVPLPRNVKYASLGEAKLPARHQRQSEALPRINTAIIVVGLLFVALIGWRMWPHSLSDMISVANVSITSFSATASIGGINKGKSYSSCNTNVL